MTTHIILTVHHDNARHIIKVGKHDSPASLVEQCQRNLRQLGQPDGVTWKTYDGSIAGALTQGCGSA